MKWKDFFLIKEVLWVYPEYGVIEYLKGALTKTIKTPNSIFR